MALIIEIKVVPGSGRQKWVMDKSGILKCFLKNLPEKGQANSELIQFVAKSLGVPQKNVELVAGHTSRRKKIKIDAPLTMAQFLEKLGVQELDKQAGLFQD